MQLLSALVGAGASRSTVRFLDSGVTASGADLASDGRGVVERCASDSGAVLVAMTNTVECVTMFLGALEAGITVVSVPPPVGRGPTEATTALIDRAVHETGATVLLSDDRTVAKLVDRSGDAIPMTVDQARARVRGSRPSGTSGFRLVQYTSGSTGTPKGVVLTDAQLGANVLALLEVLELSPGDASCSWLPLSHDMGLVGILLTSLAAPVGASIGRVECNLLRPETFLRSPTSWLRALSETRSSITATPDFGLRLVLARSVSRGDLDLAAVRSVIVGAEPLRCETLLDFAQTFAPCGLSSEAISPAYGMAEIGVAATLTPPGRRWAQTSIAEHGSSFEAVLCGPPLPGYDLVVDAKAQAWGPISLRGPSLASSYSDGTAVLDADGWFHTRDVGTVVDGDIVVLGRDDDVLVVNGRSHIATAFDAAIASVDGVKAGRAAAVCLTDGRLVAIAELDRSGSADSARVLRAVKQEVARRCSVSPDVVLAVGGGEIPRTASGKVRRFDLALQVQQRALAISAAIGDLGEPPSTGG